MANDQVQGVIPLQGRGYVHRTTRQYQLGEYKEAINVQLSEVGTLVPRTPVQGFIHHPNTSLEDYKVFSEIIGHEDYRPVISCSGNSEPQMWIGDSFVLRPFINHPMSSVFKVAADNRPVDGDIDSIHQTPMAFFVYNNRRYFIIETIYRPEGSTANDLSVVRYLSIVSSEATPIGFATGEGIFETNVVDEIFGDMYGALGGHNIDTYYDNNHVYPKKWLADWLIHKERLWLAVGDTLYASVATSPGNFEVVDGGFFARFNDEIKSISAVGDNLYVIADSSIYVVRYNADPNEDSEIITISETVGGESSTVLDDTVYTLKPHGIYAINGMNVNKILDLQLDLFATQNIRYAWDNTFDQDKQGLSFRPKLLGLDNKLYIVFRYVEYQNTPLGTDLSPLPFSWQYSNGHRTFQDLDLPGNYREDRDQCIVIDLDSGFISRYTFGMNGLPIDFYLIPVEDSLNQTKLCFVGRTGVVGTGVSTLFALGSRPMYLDAVKSKSGTSDFQSDTPFWIIKSTVLSGNSHYYNTDTGHIAGASVFGSPQSEDEYDAFKLWASEVPETQIEFVNFSPDNMRWATKKYRTFMIETDPALLRSSPNPNNILVENNGTMYDRFDQSGVSSTINSGLGTYSSEIDDSLENVGFSGMNLSQYYRFRVGTSPPLGHFGFYIGGDPNLTSLPGSTGIPVDNVGIHRFGFYFRRSLTSAMTVRVSFYDVNRDRISTVPVDAYTLTANTWKWIADSFTVPVGTEYIAIGITHNYTPAEFATFDLTQVVVLSGDGDPLREREFYSPRSLHHLNIRVNSELNQASSPIIDRPIEKTFTVSDEDISAHLTMEAFRFGLNQRGLSLDILLRNEPVTYGFWVSDVVDSFWEVKDLRTMWSYTKKAVGSPRPRFGGGIGG